MAQPCTSFPRMLRAKPLPSLRSHCFSPTFSHWREMKKSPAQRLPCSHLAGSSQASLRTFPNLPNSVFPPGLCRYTRLPVPTTPSYSPGVKIKVIRRNKQRDGGAGALPTSTSLQWWGWKGWRCRTGSWKVPNASLVALSATVRVRAGRERVSHQNDLGWPRGLGKGRAGEGMGRGLGEGLVEEGTEAMGGLIHFQQPLPLSGHGGVNRGRIYTHPGFICTPTHMHPQEPSRAYPRHPQESEACEQLAPMLRFPFKKPGFPAYPSNLPPCLQPTSLSCRGAILP